MPRIGLAFNLYLLTLGLFVLHRVLTWPFLIAGFQQAHDNVLQIFFVGLLSDHWIAMLSSFMAWLCGMALGRRVALVLAFCFLMLAGLVTTLHQPYTEFFRFQVIPYHLHYLTDTDFIRSNAASLLSWRTFIQLSLTIAAVCLLPRVRLMQIRSPQVFYAMMTPLAISAVITHAMNIHYRVQLFIPENLQMNVFEKLFMEITKSKIAPKITPPQLAALLNRYTGQTATGRLESLLAHRVGDSRPGSVLSKLKERLDFHTQRGDKPVIVVVLAESLRTSEVGAYGTSGATSLTPHIDQLINSGIAFRSAYSTGTVTRGAQEAVLCGYFGGMSTSLMRNRPDVKISCIPQLIQGGLLPNGKRAVAFWYHGGEGRFDGQLSFWSSRGIQSLLSYKDFPRGTPQTDWGYSDQALVAASLQKIAALRSRRDVDILYGTILTVTNHIPWTLPADTPSGLPSKGIPNAHESWHTSAYTDTAIGEFVRGLKESQMWYRTIMIIAGDHGNLLPPYQPVLGHRSNPEEMQTHIPLAISGGITETVLESSSPATFNFELEDGHWVSQITSQADIGPLLSYLLGLHEARFLGELPLAEKRRCPVVSDLGQSVFVPALRTTIADSELINPRLVRAESERETVTLYYRAFLQYLTETR